VVASVLEGLDNRVGFDDGTGLAFGGSRYLGGYVKF
jgi:hypothetical protein